MKPIEILSANVYGQDGAFLPGLSRDSARLLIEGSGPGVFQLAAADAQALADVRTLDATFDGISFQWGTTETGCTLWFPDGTNRTFTAHTPEAARALAAAWVREQAKGAEP